MSQIDLERRDPPRPDRVTPWWIAAMVAIVAIVAVTVVLLSRDPANPQASFNQGVSQATTSDANLQAQNAAAQANSAASAANASAVDAQNQAARRNQQNEDNPAMQPQVPAGVTSAAPPGVTSNSSSPPPQ